ncbi:hypothetical protein Gpo141_00007782 [Globisporangium polare]
MVATTTTVTTAKKRKMSSEDAVVTSPSDVSASDSDRCGATAVDLQSPVVNTSTTTATTQTLATSVHTSAGTPVVVPDAVAATSLPIVSAAAPSAYKPTFHRRVLPQECIAFSSAEGRKLFTEAITSVNGTTNYMQIYFPLAEQFTTQAEPAFCGLATLAMCLNALHIDPGRIWKGAWRWFSEELLDCCTPLETAKEQGISFAQFVCLARCNGALADDVRADSALSLERFREIVKRACATSDEIVVLNYTRKALDQTGDGHFSPIGGYNEASDMVLLMDVARFKYPPHWVRLPLVFEAIQRVDQSSGLPRGLVVLKENTTTTGQLTPANQILASRKEMAGGASELAQAPQSCCSKNQTAMPNCSTSAAAARSTGQQ